jgi:O-antigen/teichoic acid export membrane protein
MAQVFSCSLMSQVMMGGVGLLIIRFMCEAEYARLTLAFSVVAAASQTLSGGFNRIYLVSREELGLSDRVSEFLGLQLLVLGCVVALSLPAIEWLGSLYPFAAALLVARCLADYAQTVFQRELEFVRYGLVMLGQPLAILAATVSVLAGAGGQLKAWQVLLLQAVALLTVFSLNVIPRVAVARVCDFPQSRRLAVTLLQGKHGFLFAYFSTLAVFSQIDIWVLRATANDVALATYGTAFRYYSLLMLALSAVHAVLLPHLQRLKSLAELDAIFVKHRRMVALFVPVVASGAWLAQWVIPWIDQGRYPQAVPVFWILAGMAVVSFALSPLVNLLICAGDFRFLFGLVALLLPLHVGCCLWLTATLGVCGTAIATFLAYGVVNGTIFWRARILRSRWLPPANAMPDRMITQGRSAS